jgi:tetrapyrrole methylase family protein/MazG family protein
LYYTTLAARRCGSGTIPDHPSMRRKQTMKPDQSSFEDLVAIMRRLRAPGGCPWDAEQTHESLTRYLLEEAYEVIEAIEARSADHLREELGDLLLQPVFHAAIAEESGVFTIGDVIQTLCDKLVRRHPHVFGDMEISDSSAQVENWERIKKREKGAERPSALSGVPPQLPALLKAQKITEKASRVGFDWEHVDQVMAKVMEELHEFEEAMAGNDNDRMEAELGDLLFAIVNLGRFLSINPEEALRKTINRFQNRFRYVEERLADQGKQMVSTPLEEMDLLWEEAKEREKRIPTGPVTEL